MANTRGERGVDNPAATEGRYLLKDFFRLFSLSVTHTSVSLYDDELFCVM